MTKGKYIRTQETLEKLRTPKIIENKILEDYFKNINVRQIAKKNDVNVSCIYRILKRNNLNLKGYKLRVRTKIMNEKVSIASKKSWKNPKIRKKRIDGLNKVRKQIGISKKIASGTYGETEEEERKRINKCKRNWRIKNPEKCKKIRDNWIKKYPEKIKAEHFCYKKIEIYENQLCEICNKKKAVHRHHEDYSQPLNIIFLCAKCHSQIHKNRRLLLMKVFH